MTAIADIIVKPSTENTSKELQLSQNLNSHSSSTVSFSDLLNQQKRIDSTEYSKNENQNNANSIESTEEENILEKTDPIEKSKAKEISKTTENKDESKTEKTDSKDDVKNEKQFGKKIEIKSENKKETADNKKVADSKDNKKSLVKNISKADDEKKLDNEFNRLNEIVNSVKDVSDENIQSQIVVAQFQEVQSNEINNVIEENVQLQDVVEVSGKKEKTSDFDFDLDKTKAGKISKLDKDGKITVNDLRSEKTEIKTGEKVRINAETTVEMTDEQTATFTMELSSQNAENNILSLNNQAAASDGSNFQAMLNNQIQQNAPEFVKAGSLILKDNDKGTINLILHPEEIGNVKIHLSLDGKTVSAQITVNTKEAMEVFKDNAQTLREAFAQNGFDTANFDVSYNNQGGQNQQNFENNFTGTEFIAKHAYDDYAISSSDEYIQENFENISEYSINIVA